MRVNQSDLKPEREFSEVYLINMEKDQEYFLEIRYTPEDLKEWVDVCHQGHYSEILVTHEDLPQFYVEVRAVLVQGLGSKNCPQAIKRELLKRIENLTPYLALWMLENGKTEVLTVPNSLEKN